MTVPTDPSPWIVRFAPLIPAGGEVLDLACGSGRHARLLAGLGYRVEAVDRDADALATLDGVRNVTTRCVDLEEGPWPFHGCSFAGIVISRYLYRPLMPLLFNCLAPGGVLLYETFMAGQERYGRPANPAHLLRVGELLDLVRGRLTVIAFEQGEIAGPQVVQRLCARRGTPLTLP